MTNNRENSGERRKDKIEDKWQKKGLRTYMKEKKTSIIWWTQIGNIILFFCFVQKYFGSWREESVGIFRNNIKVYK